MNHKNKIAKYGLCIMVIVLAVTGCKKLDRPALGNYPKDANPPGGPLKFYVAFDGTTSNPLMNAVDSIRANFPSSNPFTTIDGVEGKAVQGVDQKAILYPSANDFNKATSFTLAFCFFIRPYPPCLLLYIALPVLMPHWHCAEKENECPQATKRR